MRPSPAHDAEINRVITELNAALRADIDPRTTPSFTSRTAAEAAASGLPATVAQILVREGTALVVRSRTATADDPLYATAPRWGVVDRQDTRALLARLTLPLGAVGGTANAISANFPGHLVGIGITTTNLRRIRFTAVSANTAAVALSISGALPVALRSPTGTTLAAGAISAGQVVEADLVGGVWRIVTAVDDAARAQIAEVGLCVSTDSDSRILAIEDQAGERVAWIDDTGGVFLPNTADQSVHRIFTPSPPLSGRRKR